MNVPCKKVLGQIGIAFHPPAEAIVFNRPQGKFSADFFLFAFHGQTCEQKSKKYIL